MAASAVGKRRGRPKAKATPKKKSRVRGAAVASTKKAAPKKATVGAASSKTFEGKTYSFMSCFGSVVSAKKAACDVRANGKLARVVDGCVYTRSKK